MRVALSEKAPALKFFGILELKPGGPNGELLRVLVTLERSYTQQRRISHGLIAGKFREKKASG